MNIVFNKIGGLVLTTKTRHFCIFPANVRFARSPGVIVAFGIGFSHGTMRDTLRDE